MTRAVPLVTRGISTLLLGVSAIALTACAELAATTAQDAPAKPEAQTSNIKKTKAPKKAAKVQDVPAPTAFAATDTAIWDGRPSLGAIWVSHPDAQQAERVQIVNKATGKKIAGALFKRKNRAAGPPIQMSSQAALALGVGPGQTTELQITAIRPADDIPIRMAEAPAKTEIWGNNEPEVQPETELLLAAQDIQDAPAFDEGGFELAGGVPMGVFSDYDGAVLVQARLSQAGVRSEIRETYLDEVIFYKVFAEQAETNVMVAEVETSPSFDVAQLERITLPDLQTTVLTKPRNDAPVQLRMSDAVIVAQLNLDDVAPPLETALGVTMPGAENSAKAEAIAPMTVASVSEGQALKPFLTFDAAVQYAGVSLANPIFAELGAIALPTRAHEAAPEVANTSELARASINFQQAPLSQIKGRATELVASVSRPQAPRQDGRPHVSAAFHDEPITRPSHPSSLAQALSTYDAPTKPLSRSDVTVMASLEPLSEQSVQMAETYAPVSTTSPTAANLPAGLAQAQAITELPIRPGKRATVTLMANFALNSVAPEALAPALAPSLMITPRIAPHAQQGIKVAMLGDGLPTVGATFQPASALAGTRILARATPRPKAKTAQSKAEPKVKVMTMASILDLDLNTITDANGLQLAVVKPNTAELPNFAFGTAQSGGDGGNWFGLNLLGTN